MKSATGVLMKRLNRFLLIQSGRGDQGRKNEIHFFGAEFNSSACPVKEYLLRFPRAPLEMTPYTFDKSPAYVQDHDTLKQIKSTLPGVKLILLLRNPVSRAYSAFQHHCRHARYVQYNGHIVNLRSHAAIREGLSYGPSLTNLTVTKRGRSLKILAYPCDPGDFHRYYTCSSAMSPKVQSAVNYTEMNKEEVDIGLYAHQLEGLFGLFDKKDVLVLFQEEMRDNEGQVERRVIDFLDTGMLPMKETASTNKGTNTHSAPVRDFMYRIGLGTKKSRIKPMLKKTEEALGNFYRASNQRTATILGQMKISLPSEWVI